MIAMSIAIVKNLYRFGSKTLRPTVHNLLRMSTKECPPGNSQESSAPKPEPCVSKPQEPCAKKPEPCLPKGTASTPCSELPPCPEMPPCPPSPCPAVADPNNPCNYCPPPCRDPDYPDLTKLKKNQCLFQEDDDDEVPVFLKKGKADAFVFQLLIVSLIVSLATAIYSSVMVVMK